MVQLPPQAAGIALPPQPQNPPTLNDIFHAVDYNTRIRASHGANVATPTDVAHGAIYESSVIGEHAGPAVAPPWFAAASAAALAAALPATLAAALPAALAPLLAPLTRVTFINNNRQCGDGLQRPFEIVPFANGNDPTQHPHNLPALRNENDIIALTGPQCHNYLVGYGVLPANVPHTVVACKRALRVHIGCSVGI